MVQTCRVGPTSKYDPRLVGVLCLDSEVVVSDHTRRLKDRCLDFHSRSLVVGRVWTRETNPSYWTYESQVTTVSSDSRSTVTGSLLDQTFPWKRKDTICPRVSLIRQSFTRRHRTRRPLRRMRESETSKRTGRYIRSGVRWFVYSSWGVVTRLLLGREKERQKEYIDDPKGDIRPPTTRNVPC